MAIGVCSNVEGLLEVGLGLEIDGSWLW